MTTIRYGKNLAGLKATYSTKGVVTAILPYFTYRPEREEGQEDQREDVTIVGDVVKSGNVDSYPYVLYEAVEYNEEDDGVTDVASLNQAASRYFRDYPDKDMPSINMEINMLDLSHTKEYEKFKGLEEVELGDTVTVYAAPFDMEVTAKVNRVVYNGLTEENEELEVGTTRASQYDNYRDLIDRTVDRSVQPIKEQLNIVQVAANGKNRIFRGPQEPTQNLQEGDLWFKSIAQGGTEIYQFNGWTWGDPIVSTEELNRVAQEVDLALTEAQEAKDEAQQSYTNSVAYTDDKVATETTELYNKLDSRIEDQAAYTDSAVSTVQTQLDNSWAVQTLNSDKDVMAEIAITNSTARIQGKNILLDGQVTMEQAFIDDIQAHSINAVEADITSIVTNHLGANAITAEHLDVTTGMIDELFADKALTQQLTSKVAFIDEIRTYGLSADQIQAGTLDASLVNVININADNIVGNTTEFIRSNWNRAAGGNVRIDGSGILTTAWDNSQTYMQNGIVGTRQPNGATVGQIGYVEWAEHDRPFYNVAVSDGSHFRIAHATGKTGSSGGSIYNTTFDLMAGGRE
ncbi:hypothetical protein CVR97_28170, partial [Salmonella enterica subsp. enterica serovar Typhimurium]